MLLLDVPEMNDRDVMMSCLKCPPREVKLIESLYTCGSSGQMSTTRTAICALGPTWLSSAVRTLKFLRRV